MKNNMNILQKWIRAPRQFYEHLSVCKTVKGNFSVLQCIEYASLNKMMD